MLNIMKYNCNIVIDKCIIIAYNVYVKISCVFGFLQMGGYAVMKSAGMKIDRTNEKIILHSDMKNFYASVECMLNPNLRDKYVAVCGRQSDRHGIVLAKNEKAKSMGVSTGEQIWKAKQKCPNLVVVEPHFELYMKYSKLAHEIYYKYTDLIEPFGLDECWLDVTGSTLLFGNGHEIACKIKEEIKETLGLTVSIGVSFSKIFAKLGSDMKKPDAVTCITREGYKDKVWPLPASEMLGVGRATADKLLHHGVSTIGDIANANPDHLRNWLGINGVKLWNFANGRGGTQIAPYEYIPPVKSVGNGITCVEDLNDETEVWKVIFELSRKVSRRLRKQGLMPEGIAVAIKDKDLHYQEFQMKMPKPSYSAFGLAEKAFELFKQHYEWKQSVRAVTVRAINLVSEKVDVQLNMFEDINKELKRESLERSIEYIKDMYGENSVTYGSLLGDIKLPAAHKINTVMPNIMYQ